MYDSVFRRHLQWFESCTFSELRENDSLLLLIFALPIGIAGFARLVRLEKQNLAQTFISVDLCRQRRGVGDLESDEAFPFGLKGRHVHDNSAARVG